MSGKSVVSIEDVELATRRWLENLVIGLNLCPFAKSVYVKNQVRIVVYTGLLEDLLAFLQQELLLLQNTPAEQLDTTLVVLPELLQDYYQFNDFLNFTDDLLVQLDLEGEMQIADFHPDYQFAGTVPNDMSNYTNRTPYPTLHLLRESSIDRAVAQYPEAEAIFSRNIERMQQLGYQAWQELMQKPGNLTGK